MGNAYLWWYPGSTTSVESIDLGPGLSDLIETPDPVVEAAEALSGSQSRVTYRGRYSVQIRLERIAGTTTAGRALVRSLWSLQTHLDGGGWVAFARDRDQAWAGFTFPAGPDRGGLTVSCVGAATGGAFPFYSAATLAAGSEVVIQAAEPEQHQRELLLVSSFSSTSTITLDTQGARYDWRAVPAMVRHRDFYPLLRQPVDRIGTSILLSERRIGYTLDLDLVEDASAINALRTLGGGGAMTTDGSRGGSTLPTQLAILQGVTQGSTAAGSSRRGPV